MSYLEDARELLKDLDQRMGPSIYDVGWVARLRDPVTSEARWPWLIDWLMENQHEDGSWGGEIEYYHDRVICTLSAIIALDEYNDSLNTRMAIKRGEKYIWHHLHLLMQDPFELVGFELIVSTLLAQARARSLDVPSHTCGYGEIQTEKLKLIPSDLLYSPNISTVHSLEFLGNSADPDKLRGALASNGSIGNSPAATAFYLSLDHNKHALAYLESLQDHLDCITVVYPFRTFELTWVLNNLAFSGVAVSKFADSDIWERLLAEMGPRGWGADSTFGIPDGDTTAVTCRLLRSAGYDVDHRILKNYEDQDLHIIRTYDYERNASVSTNVHALEALQLLPDYPNRDLVREQIILMLLDQRDFNIYWKDKWHASPYYATSHVLIGLLREESYIAYTLKHTIEWLLHTQRDDGSWGFFGRGTAEETAYVLTALLHYHCHVPVDLSVLRRAHIYLARAYEMQDRYPALWIEKCLYVPYDIVKSAILGALILYERTVGSE